MGSESSLTRLIGAITIFAAILNLALAAQQQGPASPASHTQVVLLGTGNPVPDLIALGPLPRLW